LRLRFRQTLPAWRRGGQFVQRRLLHRPL
jgi:hypothetical protein